jgi:uncharacterized protein YjbI with pentapeptide repeats
MNNEKSTEQPDSAKLPRGEKEPTDNKAAASEPDEVKKQRLQDSFKRVHERSDKFSHEWDLKREAKKLNMKDEEYRNWYELRPKPRTWFYWIFRNRVFIWLSQPIRVFWYGIGLGNIWRWTGLGEKKFWDFLQLLIVPAVLAGGAYYLQELAKQREQAASIETANQDTLVKYLDQMAELLQKGLLKTKPNSETFIIAQAKTVIALQALDPKRQHLVIQFLDAANLNTLPGEKGILYEARMSKANLNKADLSWANLSKADLDEANLSEANLSGANLSNAYFGKANLSVADLSEANLSEANLSRADLSKAKLLGAKLNGIDLSMADLSEANLFGAKLIGAKLSKSKFIGANLIGADLSKADLSEANLSRAQLIASKLIGADLSNANLYEAETLSKVQLKLVLDQAKLCNTTLPDGEVSNRDCGK